MKGMGRIRQEKKKGQVNVFNSIRTDEGMDEETKS